MCEELEKLNIDPVNIDEKLIRYVLIGILQRYLVDSTEDKKIKDDLCEKSIRNIELSRGLLEKHPLFTTFVLYHLALSYHKTKRVVDAKNLLLHVIQTYEDVTLHKSKFFRGDRIIPAPENLYLSLGFIALDAGDLRLSLASFTNVKVTVSHISTDNIFNYDKTFQSLKSYGLGVLHKRFAMKQNKRDTTFETDLTKASKYFEEARYCIDTKLIDLHLMELKNYSMTRSKLSNLFFNFTSCAAQRKIAEQKKVEEKHENEEQAPKQYGGLLFQQKQQQEMQHKENQQQKAAGKRVESGGEQPTAKLPEEKRHKGGPQ
jgi:hypothetical protein